MDKNEERGKKKNEAQKSCRCSESKYSSRVNLEYIINGTNNLFTLYSEDPKLMNDLGSLPEFFKVYTCIQFSNNGKFLI